MAVPQTPKISLWIVFWLAFLLNFIAQAAHEAGHWAVYELGGHGPTWGFTRLVQTDIEPLHPEQWLSITSSDGDQSWERLKSSPGSRLENVVAAAGGPLMSLLTAIFGLTLAIRSRQPRWQALGLALALVMSFTMSAYYLRSPMRTGGDEAHVAALFGLPKFALDIPLGLAFLVCFALGLRLLNGWRTRLQWFGLVILASITGGIFLVQLDPIVTAQVDQANPLFQSVLGYSLPVFLFNGLVLFSLCLTLFKWDAIMQPISRPTNHLP